MDSSRELLLDFSRELFLDFSRELFLDLSWWTDRFLFLFLILLLFIDFVDSLLRRHMRNLTILDKGVRTRMDILLHFLLQHGAVSYVHSRILSRVETVFLLVHHGNRVVRCFFVSIFGVVAVGYRGIFFSLFLYDVSAHVEVANLGLGFGTNHLVVVSLNSLLIWLRWHLCSRRLLFLNYVLLGIHLRVKCLEKLFRYECLHRCLIVIINCFDLHRGGNLLAFSQHVCVLTLAHKNHAEVVCWGLLFKH